MFLRCKRVKCIVKVLFWWWPDELIAFEQVTAGRWKLIFPCKVLLAVDQEKLSAMGSLHETKCSLSPATPPLAAAISSGTTFHLTAYFLFAVGHSCAKSGRLWKSARLRFACQRGHCLHVVNLKMPIAPNPKTRGTSFRSF